MRELDLPGPIYLDKIYKAPNKPVLIVVDLRVALYQMLGRFNLSSLDATSVWQYYLNAIPSIIHKTLKDSYVVVVDDWRSSENYNYWREDWLRENYPQGSCYKGDRGVRSDSDRPDGYNVLLSAAHEYCTDAGIPLFRQESFEADDWAGEFWRLANGKWQTILVSIDNDWGQLVDNKKDVIQYINGAFKVPISRLRSEYEILKYYEEREDVLLESPYDVVDFKSEYGDAGDSIDAGTPREVIDLRYPPLRPREPDTSKIFMYKANAQQAFVALQQITKQEFRRI